MLVHLAAALAGLAAYLDAVGGKFHGRVLVKSSGERMQITKLRLIGFKSFVEPTELMVEPGLTGVVGPNGCGKSNLLEALRWVMGESSYKSMRASAMDDVIFSGTTARPARNMAEVAVFIDNSERTAPAEYNDNDQIEIARRIEREAGSAYRINGSEVRARDVKILFEDAATGARSPSLVRQGQIGEIVNAKPEQRRRILEDAAGTAGLHSRRHEAELRLRGAENNLARIGDVVGQLKSQIDSLKRQARQARRYSELSDEIRKAEALQHYLSWLTAQQQVDHDEAALQVALEALGAATTKEAGATKSEAELAESLQPLRNEEVTRAAVLARLKNEQTNLDNDVRRARTRAEELQARGQQLTADIERERGLIGEAEQLRDKLIADLAALDAEVGDCGDSEADVEQRLKVAQGELEAAEQQLAKVTGEQAEARAQRSSAAAQIAERRALQQHLEAQRAQLLTQIEQVRAAAPDAAKLRELQLHVAALQSAIDTLEQQSGDAEQAVAGARENVRSAQGEREQSRLALRQVEIEQETLARMVQASHTEVPAIVEQVTVAKGVEAALGAALGDDLELPIGVEDAVHWRVAVGADDDSREDPQLPEGAEPLIAHIEAPPELIRRLRQVGLVDRDSGAALQSQLRPGQRLVSKEGDLWRWDGLVAPADVPTPAAQRLAARNRLRELAVSEQQARSALDVVDARSNAAEQALRSAVAHEQELRQVQRRQVDDVKQSRVQLEAMERAARDTEARLAALDEAVESRSRDLGEASAQLVASEAGLAELPAADHLDDSLAQSRSVSAEARETVAALRAELASLERERQRRSAQRETLTADQKRWSARAEQGTSHVASLDTRLTETMDELRTISDVPEQLAERRHKLFNELSEAEQARRKAADELLEAEEALKNATGEMRSAQAAVSECREIRARADARLEAARTRRAEFVRAMQEIFEAAPEGCLEIAGFSDDDKLPAVDEADARLQRLKTDRDRLGGVNLQAGEELDALSEQYNSLEGERADVEEAIAKLRAGIASLNREGRKRLKEAFESVNAHFGDLFTTLFGGGEARLEMIDDNDDPLAGGLEIIAKPPGKKPTTLSLLSGGEQTLTALSLIFAVFLTNPSPICVLDEVDAPLDDANVDRFCTLMDKMCADTDTRFLVITHHPMTMARVDRLYGVTMVERGVSQLVSVDLTEAEEFLDVG